MADYSVATRDDASDWMAEYPGFGEMRSYTGAIEAEEMALTWRRMPPGTGGRGSYGHRHRDQEEVYFVLRGAVTFKVGDDVFEAGPLTAVRISTTAFRSVHNDGADEAELVILSKRATGDEGEVEKLDGFWPDEG